VGAVVAGDVQGVGVDERSPPVHFIDLVLLHQEVDALDPAVGDRPAAGVGGAVVDPHLTVEADPEGLRLGRHQVCQLGVAQQGLGRDAADVQADPAPVLSLDHGNLLAELGGPDGGDIPAGSGSKDDDVVVTRLTSHTPNGSHALVRCPLASGCAV
jgi:hypothetical protein